MNDMIRIASFCLLLFLVGCVPRAALKAGPVGVEIGTDRQQAQVVVVPGAPPTPTTRQQALALTAVYPDGNRGVDLEVQTWDDAQRLYSGRTNADGLLTLIVWAAEDVPHFPTWKYRTRTGEWVPIVAPLVYPLDAGAGYRATLVLTEAPRVGGDR